MQFRATTIAWYLLAICLFFIGLYILLLFVTPGFNALEKGGLAGLFNVNNEVSIPTWFSQIILLGCATLLLAIGYAVKSQKRYWKGLGWIFIYLSIDEGASIHELTASPLQALLNIDSGPLYYTWVVLFGGIFAILVLIYLKFYVSLPSRTKALFLLSAVLFLCGAIGFEMVSGSIATQTGESGLDYSLLVAGEELLEMTGVILFIYGLLDYIEKQKLLR
jgi:hypothetical protein